MDKPDNMQEDYVITFEKHHNRCKLYESHIREPEHERDRLKNAEPSEVNERVRKKHEEETLWLRNSLRMMSKNLNHYEEDVVPGHVRLYEMTIKKLEETESRLNKIPEWIRKLFNATDKQ